jgi:hypothetical protein
LEDSTGFPFENGASARPSRAIANSRPRRDDLPPVLVQT